MGRYIVFVLPGEVLEGVYTEIPESVLVSDKELVNQAFYDALAAAEVERNEGEEENQG